MAESAFRLWKDLHGDLLTEIARRLPCPVDRRNMLMVCHDWWLGVRQPQLPRQLPWLLLPETTTSPVPSPCRMRRVSFYCVISNGETHNLRIGEDTGNSRFFGCYDGGWLMLARGQTNGHMLLNLHKDQRLFLPNHVYCVASVAMGGGVRAAMSISILAATFSSPPERDTPCFGAAIIDSPCSTRCPQLAFWSMEVANVRPPAAMGFMETLCGSSSRLEDVIHHKGAFHFLSNLEHVVVYDISKLKENERGTGACLGINAHHYEYLVQGGPRSSRSIRGRYLVESDGELLMVVRFVGDHPRWSPHTGGFQVYQATQSLTGAGLVQHAWTELHSLDGRMMFVGRGCSRSYNVADFPGSSFGEGIYFFDDRNSNDIAMMSLYAHVTPRRRYTTSDNGRCRWVEGEPRVQVFRRWFTRKKFSDYSNPMWFLP
ncbi:uncharacterized protein [Lolium perenne]|uniref:uncharacterized protein n=1 Tax=Lolium perenne TaxID=4522 RepID=UPI0021F670EF|nr:uncharacterized protein LOC127329796 [Lolium perenne]